MKWFIYAPLQLVCMIVCYLTNWIVVLFADQNGELPGLLWLWQTWDDSLDSEDCVTKYVPSIIRYDFYKYYRVERHLLPEYNRWHKYSINIAPLPLIDRIKRYCCRVFWLYRNCAYGFAFEWFGCNVPPDSVKVYADYKAGEHELYYASSRNHWMLYCTLPINRYFRWRIYLGWKLSPYITSYHRAMIAFRVWFCRDK